MKLRSALQIPRGPVLLRGGAVIAMDARRTALDAADIFITGGRIEAIGKRLRAPRGAEVIDCRGCAVIPGLIQAHVHLCQVLFRNYADGLELLDWLRERIWPFEAAHDVKSISLSANLGIAELLLGGTTAVLDMGTVQHTEGVLRAALDAGIRYTGGKALMDQGRGVPAPLLEKTGDAIEEATRLGRAWHGRDGDRIRYALCPRFVLSCSERLWRACGELSESEGWLIHTHASENRKECEAVRRAVGTDNILHFGNLGLCNERLVLAHCVHLTPREEALLAKSGAHAVHCPGANLKLASGFMPLPKLLKRKINVALGGDGAPCNNTLDAFRELRLAATLHLPRFGPKAVPPAEALAMATINGARALGLEKKIGSIEEGKRADLAVIDLSPPHLNPRGDDLHAPIVYGAKSSDVRDVIVDGRVLVRNRALQTLDAGALARSAANEMRKLSQRSTAAPR